MNNKLIVTLMIMLAILAISAEAHRGFGGRRNRHASPFGRHFGWPSMVDFNFFHEPMPLRNWFNTVMSPRQLLSSWFDPYVMAIQKEQQQQQLEAGPGGKQKSNDDDDDEGGLTIKNVADSSQIGELAAAAFRMPSVDVSERQDALTIRLDAPGTNPSDIHVSVSDDKRRLTVSGERRQSSERDDERWHVRECSYGTWKREFALDDDIDVDQIQAAMADGVLTVELPKRQLIEATNADDQKPTVPVSVPVQLPRKSALQVEEIDEEQ